MGWQGAEAGAMAVFRDSLLSRASEADEGDKLLGAGNAGQAGEAVLGRLHER